MDAHFQGRPTPALFLFPAVLLLAALCAGCGSFTASGRGSPNQSSSLTDWFSSAPADSAKDARLRALEIQNQTLAGENRDLSTRLSAAQAANERAEKQLAAASEELALAGRLRRPEVSTAQENKRLDSRPQ